MECPLCGSEYDRAKAETDCRSGCRLWQKCGFVSCPNCYYEMVVDPGWYGVRSPSPGEETVPPRKLPSNWPLRERLYEEAVKKHVCEHCEDFGIDGTCLTKDGLGCAIFRYLPELVQIADDIHERKVEVYVPEVRKRLCLKCYHSDWNGDHCEMRANLDCGLDRYLALVLDAIEEVNATLD